MVVDTIYVRSILCCDLFSTGMVWDIRFLDCFSTVTSRRSVWGMLAANSVGYEVVSDFIFGRVCAAVGSFCRCRADWGGGSILGVVCVCRHWLRLRNAVCRIFGVAPVLASQSTTCVHTFCNLVQDTMIQHPSLGCVSPPMS